MDLMIALQVCGDFNSDTRSAVYELLSTQGVSPDHPDLSNDPCHVLPDASELTHSEWEGSVSSCPCLAVFWLPNKPRGTSRVQVRALGVFPHMTLGVEAGCNDAGGNRACP